MSGLLELFPKLVWGKRVLCRCTTNDNCLKKGMVNQPDFSMAAIESIKSANFKLGVTCIISNNGRRRRTAKRRKITNQHPAFATALDTGQQPI